MPDTDVDFLRELGEGFENDAAYKICVIGSVAIGGTLGSLTSPGLGTVAGGAAGLALGLKACKSLTPAIRHKLFSQRARLSNDELAAVVAEAKRLQPHLETRAALERIAQLRLQADRFA